MKNYYTFIFLASLTFLQFGCATNSSPTTNSEITNLENQLINDEDPHIIGQLADAYSKEYNTTKNPQTRSQAIKYYKKYLEFSPEHSGAKLGLYSLLLQEIHNQNKEDIQSYSDLEQLYNNSEIIRTNDLPSPLFTKAYWKLKRSRTDEDLKSVMSQLRDSIKENPSNALPYIILSDLQSYFKQEKLALAILRQATRTSPESSLANKAFGNLILENARDQHCVTQNKSLLEEAENALKKVIKQSPEDFESHESLESVFYFLGRNKLRLFEAKLIHKNKNDLNSKFDLANALEDDGQFEKSEKIYLELIKEEPDDAFFLKDLAQQYTITGQWNKADQYWNYYFNNKDKPRTSVYDYLKYSLVISKLNGSEEGVSFLSSKSGSLELNRWGKELVDYQLGKLSNEQLLNKAKNDCEKTEADFFIAYKYWLKGEKNLAITHFRNVLDLKVTPFFEYSAAEQALIMLEN